YPEMPESAITWAAPDHIGPISELAATLIRRVGEVPPPQRDCTEDIRMEAEIAFGTEDPMPMDKIPGTPSVFSCPECNGSLSEIKDGDLMRYRCHVGHAYSSEAMLETTGDQLERALWSALRILEERSVLLRDLATRAATGARRHTAQRFRAHAQELDAQ